MENYQEILKGYREEMIETLSELIGIRSVVEASAGEGKPFGEGVDKVYRLMLKKCEDMGFKTLDVKGYSGHAEMGEGDETMGILVHLDVVPEGEGWTTDPYKAELKDGKLYGRGTNDDKGPAVAALYAMRAVMESGAPLKKKVRLIFGLDEEAGEWEGIEPYIETVGLPDFGFTPDADFPLINAEMGIIVFDLVKKFKAQPKGGLMLKSIKGGAAYNMVPPSCTAVVSADNYSAIKEKAEAFKTGKGYDISTKPRGRSLEISVKGLTAHGARPEKGINAVSIMMEFLGELRFENDDINDFIEFYNKKIGFCLNGEKIGALLHDEITGDLIWNTGLISADEKAGSFTINVRYPVTLTAADVYEKIGPHLDEYGFGVVKITDKVGLYVPEDDKLVTTLMDIYREQTGDYESKPIAIGGGSYARAMNNGVAFGIKFPGEAATEHQKDEFIDIDNMMKGAAIYADAIYRLCCEE